MTTTVTLQFMNQFTLEKQHLLQRAKVENLMRIVQDVVGLHATVTTTPYLSLRARAAGFEKDHLDELLFQHSSLAKLRCVRTTIYVHARSNLPMVYAATASLNQKASRNYMLRRGIDEKDLKRLSQAVLDLLAEEDQPAAEIRRSLDTDLDISALLYYMCDLGLVVRRKPLRSWRDRSFRYGRFDKYYPDVDLHSITEEEALVILLRQYLTGFSPVLESDVYWWFGLPKNKIQRALAALQKETCTIQIDGLEGSYIILQEQIENLRRTKSEHPRIVNFLPMLDTYLMGYKERLRYLDPKYSEYVFDRSGNATSTILLDGKIIGVWDFEQANSPCMKLFLFEKTTKRMRETISAHAVNTGAFIADGEVDLQICSSMTPLPQRTAGGFMRPLKDR